MIKYLLTPILVFALSFPALAADDPKVFLHSIGSAAYTSSEGELRGKHHLGRQALLVEIVRELMVANNHQPIMKNLPKEQAIQQIKHAGSTLLVDIDDKEAEAGLRRVGPLQSDSVVFFTRKDQLEKFTSIDAIKDAKICSRKSTKQGDLLRAKGFTQVVEVSTYRICWDQLISGEADLTTLGQNLIPTITHVAIDIADQIANTDLYLHQYDSYIAFSADTPEETVQQWQAALNQLRASDNYESLIHHYYCQQDCF